MENEGRVSRYSARKKSVDKHGPAPIAEETWLSYEPHELPDLHRQLQQLGWRVMNVDLTGADEGQRTGNAVVETVADPSGRTNPRVAELLEEERRFLSTLPRNADTISTLPRGPLPERGSDTPDARGSMFGPQLYRIFGAPTFDASRGELAGEAAAPAVSEDNGPGVS